LYILQGLCTRHLYQRVLLYIFWTLLLYELKKGGFSSILDEELWVYMDLNIKVHNPYSLISSLN
jgi:hypothetical protein